MKTIITTVGTSIFTNLIKNSKNGTIKGLYDSLTKSLHSEWQDELDAITELRKLIEAAIKNGKKSISAETESILSITSADEVMIHFLATDTILSVLAAEVIEFWLASKFPKWHFKQKKIDKLNIESKTDFESYGFMNLINAVREIEKGASKDNRPILNISGGYKAIIPPLTLMGQLYNMPLNYIYEDSGALIEFGNLPIQFDSEVVSELAFFLDESVLNDNNFNHAWILEKLKDNKLINNQRKMTPLGMFFKDYVDKKTPESKTTIGILVEYKMLEYYKDFDSRVPKGFNVIRSEELNKNGSLVSEIDLIFEDPKDKNKIITTEIKSFYQVLNYNSFHNGYVSETGKVKKPVKEQFKIQLEYIKDEWKIVPIEVKYLVYQASTGYNTPKVKKMLIENLLVLRQIVTDVFGINKLGKPIVPFYVDILNIPLNENENSYTEFLQKRIQKYQLIEDFNF